MRPLPLFLSALVLSAAAGAVAAIVVAPRAQTQASDAGASNPIANVAKSVTQLEARQAELQKGLDELRAQLAAAPNANSRTEVGELDAAVARWMQEHAKDQVAVGAPKASAADTAHAREQQIRDAFAELTRTDLPATERQRLWSKFGKEGLTEELIAEFEKRADEDPNNPDLKVELGGAYLARTSESQGGPEAGLWATKADKVFDAALEIDPNHWEARFTKAVALSFWPPVLGKQAEAIKNFETLIAQQANAPKSPQQAQPFLFLGNMYSQMGQADKALATWQSGYAQFPDNAELKKQIDLHSGH
jgi:tetratricopeptide (TPR) repeat protein